MTQAVDVTILTKETKNKASIHVNSLPYHATDRVRTFCAICKIVTNYHITALATDCCIILNVDTIGVIRHRWKQTKSLFDELICNK